MPETANNNQGYGVLLASASAILLGFAPFFGTKLIQLELTLSNMLFWRFAMATCWMLVFSFFMRNKLKDSSHLKSSLALLTFIAVIYSMASYLFFMASKEIGTALATAIFFSFPMFVLAFAYFYRQFRITKYTVLALTAIFAGISLIKGQHTSNANLQGAAFALGSAFLYAIYVFRNRVITKTIDPFYLTLIVCCGNMIIFFLLSLGSYHFAFPPTLKDWVYIAAIGILATAIPIQLFLESLKYISAVKASILTSLQVVTTIALGWALLGEAISTMQVAGMISILLGSVVIQM